MVYCAMSGGGGGGDYSTLLNLLASCSTYRLNWDKQALYVYNIYNT